jgi:hypothetical protein
VAKQLLTKSKEDPEQLNALLTQEQKEQLGMLQSRMAFGTANLSS